MDAIDMYINDLIYYKQIKITDTDTNNTSDNSDTSDLEKQVILKSISSKYIDLPLKKRPVETSQYKNKTYYMIDREVYYHEY